MTRNATWILGCLLLLASSHAGGQEASTESPVLFGFRIDIPSHHLGKTRQVSMLLPHSYADETGPQATRYPVSYLLDGGEYFEPFAGIIRYLTMYEMIPEMIVVAVPHDDRMNELTFSRSNEANGDWPTSGGGETFHRFLAEELVPTIDRNYRTHPFRILVGHSLGGLFAVESLVRDPDLFQATLAFSPSLYWNQFEWLKNASSIFDDVGEWRQFLFVSGEQKSEEEARRLTEFERLAESSAPHGFEYRYTLFPNETHASVAIPALYQNLKQLFSGWSLEGEAWELGPDMVQAHFQGLSDRFGFPVPIPEDYLIGHALHGLERHDAPDEAILLLEFCLSLYPESAGAHVGLGQSYEAKGERGSALRHYRRGLEIDPNHEVARQRLRELGGR